MGGSRTGSAQRFETGATVAGASTNTPPCAVFIALLPTAPSGPAVPAAPHSKKPLSPDRRGRDGAVAPKSAVPPVPARNPGTDRNEDTGSPLPH